MDVKYIQELNDSLRTTIGSLKVQEPENAELMLLSYIALSNQLILEFLLSTAGVDV